MWSAETVFVCALALLGRNAQNFPTVQLVESVPAGISPSAEGYTQVAEARIFLVTSTSAFIKARMAADRCGSIDAIREVAGVLAHEEWHVRHGLDETGAYDAQLSALIYVGAVPSSPLYYKVLRSKQAVTKAASKAPKGAAGGRRSTARATRDGVDASELAAAPIRRGDRR